MPSIKEWLKRRWPDWRQKGAEEGKKLGEEFWKQARRMLVGAIIALILVVLGFPRLSSWYEKYKEKQKNPPRQVFINAEVLKAEELSPLEGVYVQVARDETTTGYTNSAGRITLPYTAEAGENTVSLIFLKKGYKRQVEYQVALPEEEGDSTMFRKYHLFPDKPADNSEGPGPAIIN